MRDIVYTSKFKRDLKKIQAGASRQLLLDLDATVSLLAADASLPDRLHDHALSGDWKPARECHIRPDVLLVYRKQESELTLLRLASYSELFE